MTQKEIFIFIAIVVFLIFSTLNQIRKLLRKNSRQKRSRYNSKYIKLPDTQKFYDWKIRISNDQNETILAQYLDFLKIYPGSKIIRKDNKKTLTYSGPELGNLKWIFFHKIVSSYKLSTASKEEFRSLLLKLGVEGVNERPNYEERDGKLKIRKGLSEEDSRIKSVGNIGEQLVRDAISLLPTQYKCVSGVVLKDNNENTLELDHIIVGPTGTFILETKAFGINEQGENTKIGIMVDKNGNWFKKEPHHQYPIPSPNEQLIRQKEFMENFLKPLNLTPTILLVLANKNARICEIKSELPCKIITINELNDFITSNRSTRKELSQAQILNILSFLDSSRIN
ncbi:MAG: nuclease-related domain-containing protein [Succinivibrionaceae bacterium]|nr:nuclease-related domain-containing protein [Succinivibrionaceae bacterium]